MEVLKGMEGVLVLATAIGVIVTMFVEVIKLSFSAGKSGNGIDKKWIPLISIVVGMIIGVLVYPFTPMELVNRLWAGAISGFMASGIYETVKNTKKL